MGVATSRVVLYENSLGWPNADSNYLAFASLNPQKNTEESRSYLAERLPLLAPTFKALATPAAVVPLVLLPACTARPIIIF